VSTAIGILAGLLTTGCWLPQLRRSWRTRSTGDISWTYLAVLTAGVVLWFVYGVMTASVAVIATNVATVVALLTLATFKARFERHPGEAIRPGGPGTSVSDRALSGRLRGSFGS